ncbi:hypothetical protein PSACC_01404 [Paramicrosporidium saccamoebae]|uniref:Uncharacterized protein n=1 Tax=Paramicrosporidium saccamoebae TaxID=1246581 RepID=A0A2H9TM22_9FUNG|nr:hypothetical protein PSACC_01404 [Paramicrosporidium saccamoebae]
MSGFERVRSPTNSSVNSTEPNTRRWNPRRRPFSQHGDDENTDGEILDLYSADRGRSMIFKSPPESPAERAAAKSQESNMESGRAMTWINKAETNSPRSVQSIGSIAIEQTRDGGMRSKMVRSNVSAGNVPATPTQRPEPLAMKERRRRYGWDESNFFSRHWKKFAIYGGVFSVIIFLFMIFFWPRTVRIVVKEVAQAGDENYELTTVDGLIEVSLLHNLETVLENPNFASIKVRRASVKGQWVMRHGNRPFFGNGTMEEKVTVSARSSKTIQIPYSVFFAGDPAQDELYLDFLARCTQRDKDQRLVQIEYMVRTDLSYLGIPFSRELNYSYKVPCPLTPSQIGAIVKASGIKLQDITLKEVGQNLKEIIDQDEAMEKIEAQAADRADEKTAENKVKEKATVRKAEKKAANDNNGAEGVAA